MNLSEGKAKIEPGLSLDLVLGPQSNPNREKVTRELGKAMLDASGYEREKIF